MSAVDEKTGTPAVDSRIIGMAPRRVDARSLADPDENVRAACMGTVITRPALATGVAIALAARLADEKETEDNRILAAHCLKHVKPLPVEALVVGLAKKQGYKVRTAAATSLIAPTGEAAGASAALAKCLLAGDKLVRGQAVFALRGIGGAAVGDVMRVVEESEKFDITRISGLDAIGFIAGGGAEEAAQALGLAERLSEGAPGLVTASARFAVASIKGARVKAGAWGRDKELSKIARPLVDLAEHEDEPVRLAAMERIGWLKDGAPSAGEMFLRVLKDGGPAEREAAALGLVRSRTPGSDAIGALTAALEDPEPKVRKAACIALTGYGNEAKPTLEKMLGMVKSKDEVEEVRRAAGECAKAIVKAEKGAYWS